MTSQPSDAASDRRRARQFSDRGAVTLAAIVWLGAASPAGRPVVFLALGWAAAVLMRRPLLVVIVCGLLAQGLADRATEGMSVDFGTTVRDRVTLLTDPKPNDQESQWRAEVSYAGKRWQLLVSADVLTPEFGEALAGERVEIEGMTTKLGWGSDWLRSRHVVGSIRVDRLGPVTSGSAVPRLANDVRRRLTDGAVSLGPRRQALFVGFVLGDDRFQDPVDAVTFRRAGLTHLLAVSGQNVAFVLALLGPVLRRLRLGGRLGLTLAVIAMFALITRFEPSVLRASVMAAIAAVAVTMGREASSIRVLAFTVAALVLVDPFLVDSIGFRLSVAASAGILLLSGPIARRLRGPRPVVLAISVTAAAQLGVAPLLLTTFGPVPVASVPGNLLAGPASGPVMMWGMSAGLVAGFTPTLAPILHVPTGLLLGWIEWVARVVPERLPGGVGALRLALILGLALVVALTARSRRRVRLVLSTGLLVTVLLPSPVGHPDLWRAEPAAGLTVWVASDGTTVVAVDGRARPRRALMTLAELGISGVDLLVGRTDATTVVPTVEAIRVDRGATIVVVPDAEREQRAGRIGCLEVSLDVMSDSVVLDVIHADDGGCTPPTEIASPDAAGARAPPP